MVTSQRYWKRSVSGLWRARDKPSYLDVAQRLPLKPSSSFPEKLDGCIGIASKNDLVLRVSRHTQQG